jgi:hypothetical protein
MLFFYYQIPSLLVLKYRGERREIQANRSGSSPINDHLWTVDCRLWTAAPFLLFKYRGERRGRGERR